LTGCIFTSILNRISKEWSSYCWRCCVFKKNYIIYPCWFLRKNLWRKNLL